MISIDTLTSFFGWCTVLNIAMLSVTVILVTVFREGLIKIHTSMFGVDRKNLELVYFQYLGHIKIAIFMLNLMPYIALKIIHSAG